MACCCDILHIKSSSITYTAATSTATSLLTITLPSVTLTNGQVYELIIAQDISTAGIAAGDNPNVVLVIGTSSTQIPVMLKMGNYVRANNILNKKVLTMIYGSDPIHSTVVAPCLR